jgi:hypothetical protein
MANRRSKNTKLSKEQAATDRFLSLPAVRRGKLFCAPWCGRGCTWVEHQAAVAGAARLIGRLGPGWKPRVHENLGWHYEAISPCGQVKVSQSGTRSFTAFFGDAGRPGGRWMAYGRTPQAAVDVVVAAVKAEVVVLVTKVQMFEGKVKP